MRAAMTCKAALALALALLLVAPAVAPAQQREATPPPAGEPPPVGYLPADAVDFRGMLPGPPEVGSLQDGLDVGEVMGLQTGADAGRWKTALDDDAYVFPRFDDAFGQPIDREHTPRLVALLNRVIKDAAAPVFQAKGDFHRARPYQRYQLARVCGADAAPAPDPNPSDLSSYPSGHAAYGWIVALVLAEVAPERARQVLARGRDYGLSREVCGVHFPSDVVAGQVVATAVFQRLKEDPAFQADLAAAKAEHLADIS
jgi:acid phosphatase (class A)